tara:strand:+ start:4691 stop:6088 length:1398 start_codon:yes stop_codon:yes gene_type:complete
MRKDNKKIIFIIGLGKTGISSAKLLNSKNKKVIIIEAKNTLKLKRIANEIKKDNIEVMLGTEFKYEIFKNYLSSIESIIVSPGINWQHPTLNILRKKGIEIKGEISLAWDILKDPKWICITGTNGKTTVTSLINHILCINNISSIKGGNIGVSLSEIALKVTKKKIKTPKYIIAELSSFQIEQSPEIKPFIGIWTTFTPDHLDRHKTLRNYFNIKNTLLKNSKNRIYNFDDKLLIKNKKSLKEGIWASAEKLINQKIPKYCINDSQEVCEGSNELFNYSSFKLIGKHNLQNLSLVIAALRIIGIPARGIEKGIQSFKCLPHRMEAFYSYQGIQFFNDSKATNFESSIAGIKSLNTNSIIISGGRLKEGNPQSWAKVIAKKGFKVFLFGEASLALENYIKQEKEDIDIKTYEHLKDLISVVIEDALKNKVINVMLSPACSSYDQYSNFEERGNNFKYLIKNFIESK